MKVFYVTHKTLPDHNLTGQLGQIVDKLKSIKTKAAVLDEAYQVITSRYHGSRSKTVYRLFDAISTDWQSVWNRQGFLHCTNQNYLLTLLLIKSGHFKMEDIRRRWTLYWWLTPHQYLQIQVAPNTWVNVDTWSASYGIKLGDYSHGFHTSDK